MENNLPVTLWYWLLALIPLVTLLVLLIWTRWSAPEAGAVGFLTAVAIALLAFRSPLFTVAAATARGVWDAIFILYVIWPAVLLYQITDKAGAFDAMQSGIRNITRSRLFMVLAFGWVFASFLQGIAGFGTPIAIVAPLLVGIGVRPVMAVVIALIGHSWANMFGTLAVSWHATRLVADLDNELLTALISAWMLWIPNVLAGFAIAWLFGRWKAVKIAFWAIIVISLIHGGGQVALMYINPTLSNFVPATVAMGAVFLLARWKPYQEAAFTESPVMESDITEESEEERPHMGLHEAFFPYYILTLLTVAALVIPVIQSFLDQWQIGLPFPATTTGFGVAREAEDPYAPFAVLTHPGTFLLAASIAGYLWFMSRGRYDGSELWSITTGTVRNAVPASVAVIGFLALSRIMDNTGQIAVLALGIAAVSPPIVYAALATFIGILGAFMTSSNTASNVLFVPLHSDIAAASGGLSQSLVVGAQSAGGAIGNAIAPANVVLGTGTAGISGKEGDILRYTVWFALAAGVLVGILAVVLYLLL